MFTVMRRALRRFSFLAALVGGTLAHAAVSRAETVHTRYGISLIGLPLGSASVDATLEPGAYRIEFNARLTGLASLLSRSSGAAVATGALPDNHVRPATYATTSTGSNETRTIRMSMENGNVDQVDISPPWGQNPDRVPLTAADQRGIVDPLSSLLMPLPAGADPSGAAACNRTIPIFDGGVRFNVAMSFVGTRKVKSKGYDGPVAVCSVRYNPIAGHRPNRAGTKFMIENKQIEVWLAPVGQMRFVAPYRVSVLTMIGTVVIEATQFDVAASTTSKAH